MSRLLWTALCAVGLSAVTISGAVAGDVGVRAPAGVQPGLRLPWPEVAEPVREWQFARDVQEVSLETRDGSGYRSVTLWCVVVDKRLFIATGASPKTWVRLLQRDRDVRVGIDGRAYPVRAKPIREAQRWDAVVEAYDRKYPKYKEYDFPRRGNLKRGRIYELVARSPQGGQEPAGASPATNALPGTNAMLPPKSKQ